MTLLEDQQPIAVTLGSVSPKYTQQVPILSISFWLRESCFFMNSLADSQPPPTPLGITFTFVLLLSESDSLSFPNLSRARVYLMP